MALLEKRVAKAVYDFSADGGAIASTTALNDTESIPIGALITNCYAKIPAVGGAALDSLADGASVQIRVGTQQVSVVVAEANFIDYSPALYNSLTAIEVTATANIFLAITDEALTSGKVEIFVEYIY